MKIKLNHMLADYILLILLITGLNLILLLLNIYGEISFQIYPDIINLGANTCFIILFFLYLLVQRKKLLMKKDVTSSWLKLKHSHYLLCYL